jgi:hypothetical protein
MKLNKLLLMGAALLMLGSLNAVPTMAQTESKIAFPGAEGFGRYATGGRGGKVYHVTNLNDSGTGSLRWALGQSGKKIVVFDVSGTIHLNSSLNITSNTTVAGQSAPGDGICIADYPCVIKGNNVIVRYMRFRLGNKNVTLNGADGWDGFGSLDCNNFIIDHCSVSWSIDECLSVSGCKNVTVQWCLVSQSLVNSGHSKGNHGYGGNWGGAGSSYHHNLMAHHTSRTPRLGPRPTTQLDERMDMRNNVIYNWAGNGCYGGEAMKVNIVNNYYKPGPGTKERSTNIQKRIAGVGIRTNEYCTNYPAYAPALHIWGKYYVTGNVNSQYSDVTADNWTYGFYNQIDASGNDGTYPGDNNLTKDTIKITEPIEFPATTTHSANTAYEKVLAYVGASLHRDSYDELMISDTRDGKATYTGANCNKGCINSQDDNKPSGAGSDWSAWPTLNSTEAPTDTDRDGMPDAWETANGLNPNDASDGSAIAENGYTNVENYLNSIVAEITEKQNEDGTLMGKGGMENTSFTLSPETMDTEKSTTTNWIFNDGFTITGTNINYGSMSSYTAVTDFHPFQAKAGAQHTITIPEGVAITSISFIGYYNSGSGTSRLTELNGVTTGLDTYTFPNRNQQKTETRTIILDNPATEKITFTVNNNTCMNIKLDGVKQGEDVGPTPGGDDDPELETIATGIITWALANGKSNLTGTASNEIASLMTVNAATIGSTLDNTNMATRSLNSVKVTTFVPSIANESAANDDNALTFGITMKDGYYFQPTAIEFYAARIGTDGGKMDICWQNSYGKTTIEEGMIPERNNVTPPYTFYQATIDDQPAAAGDNNLILHILALKDKPMAVGGISITGEVKGSATTGIRTIENMPQRLTDGYFYNLQGVRIDHPTKGIYIRNGKKVVIK